MGNKPTNFYRELIFKISINHIMVDWVLDSLLAGKFLKDLIFLNKITEGSNSFLAIPSTPNSDTV